MRSLNVLRKVARKERSSLKGLTVDQLRSMTAPETQSAIKQKWEERNTIDKCQWRFADFERSLLKRVNSGLDEDESVYSVRSEAYHAFHPQKGLSELVKANNRLKEENANLKGIIEALRNQIHEADENLKNMHHEKPVVPKNASLIDRMKANRQRAVMNDSL